MKINILYTIIFLSGLFFTNAYAQSSECNYDNYETYIRSETKTKALIQRTGKGCNLEGRDFTSVNWDDAYLMKANLKDARFIGGTMKRADFTGANLKRAQLINVTANNAVFSETNLKDAQIVGSSFHDAEFKRAMCCSREAVDNYKATDFTGSDLTRADFTGTKFSAKDFKNQFQTVTGLKTLIGVSDSVKNYCSAHCERKKKQQERRNKRYKALADQEEKAMRDTKAYWCNRGLSDAQLKVHGRAWLCDDVEFNKRLEKKRNQFLQRVKE